MPGPLQAFCFLPQHRRTRVHVGLRTRASRTAVCHELCHAVSGVRTQHWFAGQSFPSRLGPIEEWTQPQRSRSSWAASARRRGGGRWTVLPLFRKGASAGTQDKAGSWLGLAATFHEPVCEPHPGGRNCTEFCSEYHWYHRRHEGKGSQLDIRIWGSQALLHTPVLSSTSTTSSGDVGRILMSLGSIKDLGMLGGVYKVHLVTL